MIRKRGSSLSIKDSDHDLVVRTQKGDSRAFDMLVLKHQHKVMGVISRYIKDRSEIEDVAQETFIKAFRALKNFRGDSQFYTWLYRIATNTAKNHIVMHSRRPPNSDVDAGEAEYMYGDSILSQIENPENKLFGEELNDVIQTTIKALPEDLRSALTLREFEGLSYEEIAEVMECPIGTVRSRIFRAREAIDNLVKPIMERNAVNVV